MLQYLWIFVFCFAISTVLIPFGIKLSYKFDFLDKPKDRKKHKQDTPLMGGVIMYISFWVTFFVFTRAFQPKYAIVFFASTIILAIGIIDDWFKSQKKDLKAFIKFIMQVLACCIICMAGITFTGFTNPITGNIITLPLWLQYILTVIWIFGITTVINFSDGLDGLAGGIVTISAMTLFFIAMARGQVLVAIMTVSIVGVGLAYLRYNKPPAKLYMGDSGATFLGFILAVISLEGVFKQATFVSVFVPVLIFGVPIFDNIYVVIKRIIDKKPIYVGDRTQLHFRLLDRGYKIEQVNGFIYGISASLSVLAFILFMAN